MGFLIVVQQLRRFQVTAPRAIPPRQLSFLYRRVVSYMEGILYSDATKVLVKLQYGHHN